MASKLLLISVFVLDLIAFGLAVVAEQRRSTAKVVQDSQVNYNYCVYDSDISTGYGVGAFLFLMVSQAIIVAVSRCFCCGKGLNPSGSRAWGVILFIVCWLFFLIAEICLLAGSVRNAYHTKYRTIFSEQPPSCETVRKGVFAAGAAFVFLNAIVNKFYYVCYSSASDKSFQPYGRETGRCRYGNLQINKAAKFGFFYLIAVDMAIWTIGFLVAFHVLRVRHRRSILFFVSDS